MAPKTCGMLSLAGDVDARPVGQHERWPVRYGGEVDTFGRQHHWFSLAAAMYQSRISAPFQCKTPA